MRTMTAAVAAVAALTVVGGATVSTAFAPAAVAAEPPIVQICAATSIEEVDDILRRVGRSDLLDGLDGLLKLDSPKDADGLSVNDSVQLDDVRKRLDCDKLSRDRDRDRDRDRSRDDNDRDRDRSRTRTTEKTTTEETTVTKAPESSDLPNDAPETGGQ